MRKVSLLVLALLACGPDQPNNPSRPVAAVRITPDSSALVTGQLKQLVARALDDKGGELTPGKIAWHSETPGTVTVDSNGVAQAVAPGTARVTAALDGLSDTAFVTVTKGDAQDAFDLVFSTFAGGADYEAVRDVATDAQGNVYIAGGTVSDNFPTTEGALQRKHNPGTPEDNRLTRSDVFVVKIDPSGKVVWSTLLGGPNHDRAYGIEVDRQGYVYLSGRAGAGFPTTPGSFQPTFLGGAPEAPQYGRQDGFVCKLRPDGSAVVFCSYFGTDDDFRPVRDLAVDSAGDIYLASGRSSGEYPEPVKRVFTNTPHGGDDAVIAKVKTDGSAVLWATYVGGSGNESHQNSVRLDGAGNPRLLITTTSNDMPMTTGAAQPAYGGKGDLFVAKFNARSGALEWGTYIGGSQNESTETHEFAVDPQGNSYVVAPTQSSDFVTTAGAFQRKFAGVHDVFAAKISPDGKQLLASTLIGGSGADRPEGVAVDPQGNVYFTGTTTSPDFPTTPNAFQSALRGKRDAIAVILAADFSRLLYSSYFGGSDLEYGRGAVVGPDLFAFGGETASADLAVRNALQPKYGGAIDAFVVRLSTKGLTTR